MATGACFCNPIPHTGKNMANAPSAPPSLAAPILEHRDFMQVGAKKEPLLQQARPPPSCHQPPTHPPLTHKHPRTNTHPQTQTKDRHVYICCQIKADSNFLAAQNIMDYSFLLGIHRLGRAAPQPGFGGRVTQRCHNPPGFATEMQSASRSFFVFLCFYGTRLFLAMSICLGLC